MAGLCFQFSFLEGLMLELQGTVEQGLDLCVLLGIRRLAPSQKPLPSEARRGQKREMRMSPEGDSAGQSGAWLRWPQWPVAGLVSVGGVRVWTLSPLGLTAEHLCSSVSGNRPASGFPGVPASVIHSPGLTMPSLRAAL